MLVSLTLIGNSLAKVGQKLNLPNKMLYSDGARLIGDPKINCVHIMTPNETHFAIASKSLEADKHVLLEKPMSLTSRDAFKLVRQAEQKGNVLLVGRIFSGLMQQ